MIYEITPTFYHIINPRTLMVWGYATTYALAVAKRDQMLRG